jgi:hypothetical protein
MYSRFLKKGKKLKDFLTEKYTILTQYLHIYTYKILLNACFNYYEIFKIFNYLCIFIILFIIFQRWVFRCF